MARDYSRTEVLGIIEREAAERNIPRDDFMRFAYIETGGSFNEQASRGAAGVPGHDSEAALLFAPSMGPQRIDELLVVLLQADIECFQASARQYLFH